MPIIILFAPLISAVAMLPLAIKEEEKEKQVNELCLKNYKKPDEIKVCKDILMNRIRQNAN